ncbi:MAG: helix-hairpin-helix domain-containing protein [Actinobacteria bacterium]|nr:helix-hairpin-helix domain-containing protein [Actinomycetota bacterium]
MNRILKVIGVVGGIAAVIWAMRDRFISVATSREPEPPAFRTPTPSSPPVETIEGIGPVFAKRLSEAGIDNLGRLAGASPDLVAEAAGVSGARARAWIEQARAWGG